jgi:hypothetical protein
MFIKWKYNDHGHPDFETLEVPDDVKTDYVSVADYICECGLVPTWSERFSMSRIKWEKIEIPPKQFLISQILQMKKDIDTQQLKIQQYQELLDKYPKE